MDSETGDLERDLHLSTSEGEYDEDGQASTAEQVTDSEDEFPEQLKTERGADKIAYGGTATAQCDRQSVL